MEDMEPITLERDNLPDLRFTGEEAGHVTSRKIDGPGSSRWTELTLYRTKAGKWVCHEVGKTQWQGEHDRYTVYVADDEKGLIDAVGTGNLAKDLYVEAGIECVEDID